MPVLVLAPPLISGPGHLCCVQVPGSWVMGPACVPRTGLGPGPGPEVGPRAGLGPGAGFWGHGLVLAQAPALASVLVGCVGVCAVS